MTDFGFTIIDQMEESLGLHSSSPHSFAAMVADGVAGRLAEPVERELEAALYHAARTVTTDADRFRVTVTFHGDRVSIDAARQ